MATAVFAAGALFSGAPTAKSQRWPGRPCAGLSKSFAVLLSAAGEVAGAALLSCTVAVAGVASGLVCVSWGMDMSVIGAVVLTFITGGVEEVVLRLVPELELQAAANIETAMRQK